MLRTKKRPINRDSDNFLESGKEVNRTDGWSRAKIPDFLRRRLWKGWKCSFQRKFGEFSHWASTYSELRTGVEFSSVTQSCPALCDPINRSTPGLPVHHKLPEFTQTHAHRIGDAIQPSYPLSSPSPPAHFLPAPGSFPMSQLFAWGGQSIGVSASASVLPMNTQDWSPLEWTGWIFLQSKGLTRVFSNTTVQKHQFFGTQLSSQFNSHIHTWPLEKP